MPLVYNALPQTVTVTAGGHYFEFKPEQIKLIHNPNIARFMGIEKAYEGLVEVPDICGEDKTHPDAQKALSEAKKTGISHRIAHLERIKQNLLVSLARDLEMKNIKIDPLRMASQGEKRALQELAKYEQAKQSDQEEEFQELKKLVEIVENGKSK